jgi:cellulose synthase/poly-beta-1,6-N-acetylglucosamine synthase-like glycosyltransferase
VSDPREYRSIGVAEIGGELAEVSARRALTLVDDAVPGGSAQRVTGRWQRAVLIAVPLLFVAIAVWRPGATAIGFAWVTTVIYLVIIIHRLSVFRASLNFDPAIRITDAEARAYSDDLLPTYTVLVPAFREPEVIRTLVDALTRLDYPRDRLEILLLLEDGDDDTLVAATSIATDLPIEVLVVPRGTPQTKPRALNFGFLHSSGDLVTVFDAEDQPEPLQLRRAAIAMSRLGPEWACLQARLEFYDAEANLLTKWFTTEYLTWFTCFLPGLVAKGAPVPLGGTSNHFRRVGLEAVGAWDPYNVTEDADLGLRLERNGYRVGMLDSFTLEEANSDVVNWVKQRSRWQKGYLQTALVHLRHPRQLRSQLGWKGFGHLVAFVLGTPVLALLNLLFWSMSVIWLVTGTEMVEKMFPGTVFYLATASWLIGNAAILYIGILSLLVTKRSELLWSAFLTPLYWILMSIASLRAVIQLVVDPSYWEKTQHGLRRGRLVEVDLREPIA